MALRVVIYPDPEGDGWRVALAGKPEHPDVVGAMGDEGSRPRTSSAARRAWKAMVRELGRAPVFVEDRAPEDEV